MSLLPFFPSAFSMDWPASCPCHGLCSSPFDHHFGLGIHPSQLSKILENPFLLRHNWAELENEMNGAVETLGKDGFQASLDVQQFKPNEVSVKVVDNVVVVEGKHEERKDNSGYISRQFTRKYLLPDEIDSKQLTSSISSDGILTIKAPKSQQTLENTKERTIEIQQTGPARDSIKANDDKL